MITLGNINKNDQLAVFEYLQNRVGKTLFYSEFERIIEPHALASLLKMLSKQGLIEINVTHMRCFRVVSVVDSII